MHKNKLKISFTFFSFFVCMCVKFGYSENIQDVENYIKEQKGKRKKTKPSVRGQTPKM